MKSIYPLAVLALAIAFTSCSDDKEDSPARGDTDTPITFSNPFIDNSVLQRAATPTTNNNLEGFRVWGFVTDPTSVVFDNARVTRADNNNWNISQTEYWYIGQNYWFTAISTGDVEDREDYTFHPITTPNPTASYAGGGTIVFDNRQAEGEEDLIYAFSGTIRHNDVSSVTPVPLTFSHLLSQVTFQFNNRMTERTNLEIKSLNMIDITANGTIDLTQGEANAIWTPVSGTFTVTDIDADDYAITFGKGIISEPTYVIPTINETSYKISFTVNVKNGNNLMGSYNHTITLPATKFDKGHSYKFIANLTPQNVNPNAQLTPIEFTVESVSDWQPDTETPVAGI